jgi:hypothetical protein
MTEQKDAGNLDAELFAAIDEWKSAWREISRLDDNDPSVAAAATKAIKLERKIARMPAMTAEGYHVKIEVIRKAGFDDDVLFNIVFLLGRDAERLGIADSPPDLRVDW